MIETVYLPTRDERRYYALCLREQGYVYDADSNLYWPPENIPFWLCPDYDGELRTLMMAS